MASYHPFHIVDQSPWPIINSLNLASFMVNMITCTKLYNKTNLSYAEFSILCLIMTSLMWWRDISRENTLQGNHTHKVTKSMKMGMILFIMSEIMFFLSFFWGYFYFSLAPEMEISNCWPPKGIFMFNPFHMPLMNTLILLSSGASITWCHHSLMNSCYKDSLKSIFMTITLGILFSILQFIEYISSEFCINDSIFGTVFFLLTGFHGIHVLIGTMFLMFSALYIYMSHFNNNHHLGFEMSAWYWHFVDVVWIYLYIFIYWWFF